MFDPKEAAMANLEGRWFGDGGGRPAEDGVRRHAQAMLDRVHDLHAGKPVAVVRRAIYDGAKACGFSIGEPAITTYADEISAGRRVTVGEAEAA
jgi:hypothetical protein